MALEGEEGEAAEGAQKTGVFRGAHDQGDADRIAREDQAALTG